jgi:hypothetical protein
MHIRNLAGYKLCGFVKLSSIALKDVDFGRRNAWIGGPNATQQHINLLFTGQVLVLVLLQHVEVLLELSDVLLEWEYLLILVVQAIHFFRDPLDARVQLPCTIIVANQAKHSLPTVHSTIKWLVPRPGVGLDASRL